MRRTIAAVFGGAAKLDGRPWDMIRFGPFEADPRTGELRRNNHRIRLQGQPAKILVSLLERPGEVVSRQELKQRIWKDNVFVDFEHSLHAAVSRLRDALRDSAEKPMYIETIGRGDDSGYRFIAQITTNNGQVRPTVVAVLPTVGLGQDFDRYLLDGVTEETTSQLARLLPGKVAVIGRTSVMACSQRGYTLAEIGAQLGADYVLESTIRDVGQRYRITYQLNRVTDHTQALSDSFDQDASASDQVSLQSNIAHTIVRAIAATLLPNEKGTTNSVAHAGSRAYELYLRGRFHWPRREQEFHLANKYYMDAIEVDPDFAPPYAGLADSFNIYGMYASGLNSDMPVTVAAAKARDFANRALDLDGGLAEAHAALGYNLMQYAWDWAGAEKHLQRATALNANCITAHQWYGWVLTEMGMFDQGVVALQRARQLDPLSPTVNAVLGWAMYFAGRLEQSRSVLESALETEDSQPLLLHCMALTYSAIGRCGEALTVMERCLSLSGDNPVSLASAVSIYLSAGQRELAESAIARLLEMRSTRIVSPFMLAMAHAGIGDDDACVKFLREAIEQQSGWIPTLAVEPAFVRVHHRPEWSELIHRLPHDFQLAFRRVARRPSRSAALNKSA